jgi:hypothetical protein
MKNATARTAYIALLNLHPRYFRKSFGSEMLQVFDEASDAYGPSWLLADATASLLRQRFLRWPDEEQLAVPAEQSLLAGTYPMPRSPHLTARKLLLAFLLSLLVMPGCIDVTGHFLSLTLIGLK